MNTNLNFLKAIAAAVLASIAGLAVAGGNTNVDVTADVPKVCAFSAAAMPVIALGSLDPSTVGATGISKTGNITYNCTPSVTPAITRTLGGTALTAGSDSIPYTFSLGSAEAGNGFLTPGSSKVVATATVTQAAVQAAAPGTYRDTVTLLIAP